MASPPKNFEDDQQYARVKWEPRFDKTRLQSYVADHDNGTLYTAGPLGTVVVQKGRAEHLVTALRAWANSIEGFVASGQPEPPKTPYVRPGWDEYWLGVAKAISARSTCSRLQVGAVIVADNAIQASGYNGRAPGMAHCVHRDDSPCRSSIHAETNAIDRALSEVFDQPSTMYVTHSPCLACATFIVRAGIGRLVYSDNYRDAAGVTYLLEHGVDVERFGKESK